MYLPTDIANLALDKIGADVVLGDIEDGTRSAQVCLRSYRECLMQLLRGAHWQFARKQAVMQCLGDVTGQDQSADRLVIHPWRYEYAYPNDCVRAIYVPWRRLPPAGANYAIPDIPISTATASNLGYPPSTKPRPAKFLISRSTNHPPAAGQITWEVQGVSPQGRTVVLTNVPKAQLVYTSLVDYPSEWDALFRGAMVAYLASEIAMPLGKDKAVAARERVAQIGLVKQKLMEARIADGNETWSSTDHIPDWLEFRRTGGGFRRGQYGYDDGGDTGEFNGWAAVDFADGSSF